MKQGKFFSIPEGVDTTLIVSAVVLSAIGIVMVYSSSAFFAAEKVGDQFYFLKKQMLAASIGVILFFAALRLSLSSYYKLVGIAYVATAVMLLLVFVPGVGTKILGARRWISIFGIRVQPSEFAKITFIAYMAWAIARIKDPTRADWLQIVKISIPALLLLGLIVAEPDFGTTVILFVVAVAMLFIAGTPIKYMLYAGGAAVVAAIPLVIFFPYRWQRIESFIRGMKFWGSEGDYKELCYQVRESVISFGSGQLTGMGLGHGKHKMFFIPQAHSDFILAIIGQEGGFLLVLAVLLLYALYLFRGFRIASNATEPFVAYFAFGLTLMLGIQIFINGGVVMGILPPKGIVLPFLSYGGSALMAAFLITGILAKLSLHTNGGERRPR